MLNHNNNENLEYNRLTRMLSNSGMLTSNNVAADFSNKGMEGDEDDNSLFSFNFLNEELLVNNNGTTTANSL